MNEAGRREEREGREGERTLRLGRRPSDSGDLESRKNDEVVSGRQRIDVTSLGVTSSLVDGVESRRSDGNSSVFTCQGSNRSNEERRKAISTQVAHFIQRAPANRLIPPSLLSSCSSSDETKGGEEKGKEREDSPPAPSIASNPNAFQLGIQLFTPSYQNAE